LSLFATQVLAQSSTTKKVTIQVPGFVSYGPQGQHFVPITSVGETEDAIKELGLVPDSIKFVAIIPVSASGVQKNLGYDQVYGKAAMQGIRPCEKWIAAKIAENNLPIKDKVYILTDVSTAFDKDGKPEEMFNIPFIEPINGVLKLKKENMGTLETFELRAEISETGEMETWYDDLKYKWKSFPSENSRIMVMMSEERMTGRAMK
jgi:hypothetical protein